MSVKEIEARAKTLIREQVELKGSVRLSLLTDKLIRDLRLPKWANRDEGLVVLYEGYRQIVGSANRSLKRAMGKAAPDQLAFQGFKNLQQAYSIIRGGEEVLVALENLTEIEMKAKEKELEAMGTACFEHMRELQRYRRKKWPSRRHLSAT